MKKMEIEQKFLLKSWPITELPLIAHSHVKRFYLYADDTREIRVNQRKLDDGTTINHLTFKSGSFLSRNEIKIQISDCEYLELYSLVQKEPLEIDNYEFELKPSHRVNIKSIVKKDILFAEIEYEDETDYEKNHLDFEKLPFLGENVTFNPFYYLKNIW